MASNQVISVNQTDSQLGTRSKLTDRCRQVTDSQVTTANPQAGGDMQKQTVPGDEQPGDSAMATV